MEIPQEQRDRIIDDEHLRLLGLGHYITGGLAIAFASLFIFHLAFLLVAAANPGMFPEAPGAHAPGPGFFATFAAVVGLMIVAGWAFGGLTIYAGRCIARRRGRMLTFVMACLNTLFIPVGTVLGVFTLIVLSRPSVKRQYEEE